MKKTLKIKSLLASGLAAILFAVFALAPAFAAPVVVIPGEGAGYIYYSSSAGASATPTPAEDPTLIGQVSAFVKLPLPDNWVECAGQNITAAAYPELVEYLAGASATSAVMPDLRGYFLRGRNQNTDGVGVARAPLNKQGDAERRMTGTLGGYTGWSVPSADGPFRFTQSTQSGGNSGTSFKHGTLSFDNAWVVPTATETRPHNIAVIYAMRAK